MNAFLANSNFSRGLTSFKSSEKQLSQFPDGVQVIPRWWHRGGGRGESTVYQFHGHILLTVCEKAASGIGKETALSFAEAGVQSVVCADLNEEGAKQVVEESKRYAKHTGYRAIAVKLDISDEESVKSLVATTVKEFGRIDYAVNSAGVGTIFILPRTCHRPRRTNTNRHNFLQIDLENYGSFTPSVDINVVTKMNDVTIKGAVLFVSATMKAMAEQQPRKYNGRYGERSLGKGSIVLLGSANSLAAAPGMVAYTAAKHALLGITKAAGKRLISSTLDFNRELSSDPICSCGCFGLEE